MIAGRLTTMLTMLRPVEVAGDFGTEVSGWEAVGTARAERVRASANRVREAGEFFSDGRAEYLVRDAHPVMEGWRVQEVGPRGVLYTVAGIVHNRQRGLLTLTCERVNE